MNNINQNKSYNRSSVTKSIKRKLRRGKRRRTKNFVKTLRFLGVNSAGLKTKLLTFKKVLNELKPAVFFVEETKYKEVGKLKLMIILYLNWLENMEIMVEGWLLVALRNSTQLLCVKGMMMLRPFLLKYF